MTEYNLWSMYRDNPQRFGSLKPIHELAERQHRHRVWLCECACGKECTVRQDQLVTGNIQSCGCQQRAAQKANLSKGWSERLELGEGCLRSLYRSYEASAAERGIYWDLSMEAFQKLTKGICYICGIEPQQVWKKKRAFGSYVYNGIDRINNDPAIGYVAGNVASCCKDCNWDKGERTLEEHLDHVWRIAQYQGWIKE